MHFLNELVTFIVIRVMKWIIIEKFLPRCQEKWGGETLFFVGVDRVLFLANKRLLLTFLHNNIFFASCTDLFLEAKMMIYFWVVFQNGTRMELVIFVVTEVRYTGMQLLSLVNHCYQAKRFEAVLPNYPGSHWNMQLNMVLNWICRLIVSVCSE